jgi:glycine cleavage system H lipoate-binding protein
MPQGYYFHLGHTWVRVEEKAEVSIGVDDFALSILGPLDKIEAPLIGTTLRQGQAAITLQRGSKTAMALSPVSGVVSTINLSVKENAATAADDPYARGWVLKIRAEDLRRDLKSLLIGNEAIQQLKGEIDRLVREIEMTTDATLSDSDARDDIVQHLPGIEWAQLVRLFLKA